MSDITPSRCTMTACNYRQVLYGITGYHMMSYMYHMIIGLKCLKRRVIKSVKKCKKQFIFNQQCYSIRCQLHYVKCLLERYPQNRDIRRDYYEIKRMYEKSVKGAKSAIKNELIEKLDELHEKDSKQYWDLFNKIRNNKKENNVSSVSASEWVKHYKHLYNKPEGYDDEIADEMRLLESCGADTEMLDQTITDSEIYDMIKKMRNGKSVDTFHSHGEKDIW